MHTDHSSTSTSEDRQPDGAAPKLTPIGLIGITRSDPAPRHEHHPLRTTPPKSVWRYARIALAIALPAGAVVAMQRITEPEGFAAADTNLGASSTSSARATTDSAVPSSTLPPPPARTFVRGAFGHSDAVRVRVVLPSEPVRLPIEFGGSTVELMAQWMGFDGRLVGTPTPWPEDGLLFAPAQTGAFWLVLSRGARADTVADLALLVERPMPNKMATGINGYHMGRWPRAAAGAVPRGFIEVTERLKDFAISPHMRLSDFVVHDGQDAFPKYLHVREALLDKIELIIGEIASMRAVSPAAVKLHVASGFRSPSHNGGLSGSAQDSRHMYGDAADIAIDANNDGKLTEIDARLVAAAAEVVERKYPDLVGGVGLYITYDGAGWPYVHVDTRGERARWRGGSNRNKVDSLPTGASFDSSGVTPAQSAGLPAAVPAGSPAAPAPATPALAEPGGPAAARPARDDLSPPAPRRVRSGRP
jgi:hypothetical protein